MKIETPDMKALFKILFILLSCSSLAQNQTICYGSVVKLTITNSQNLSNPSYSIQPSGVTNSPGIFGDLPQFTTTYTLYVTGQNSQQVTVTNSITITVTVAPLPTFSQFSQSNNYSITCAQPSVTMLTGSTYTYGSLNYSWAGASFTSNLPNVILTQPGSYSVTAMDPVTTCSTTHVFSIGLNSVIPAGNITPLSQNITCSLSAAPFTMTASSPTLNIVQSVFAPTGGVYSANTKTATYTPGTPGTYTYEIKNLLNGCVSKKQFTVSSSSNYPFFQLFSPTNFTLGCGTKSTIVVSYSNVQIPGGGAPGFTILAPGSSTTLPAGNLGSQNSYPINVPGMWTAVVRDNNGGCDTRVPFSVLSNTFAPKLDSLASTYSVLTCGLPQTTLEAFSYAPNVSYSWNIIGNSTTYSTNAFVAASQPATPTQSVANKYQITITDKNNMCKSSNSVTVLQNLYPPKAVINATSTTLTCSNSTIELINGSSTGIPPGSFPSNSLVIPQLWASPTQPTVGMKWSYNAYSPGQFSMTVIDLNNGCTSSTVITINDNRTLPQVTVPYGVVDLCHSETVLLTPLITGTDVLSFNWLAPAGATIQGQTTQTLRTNFPGIYTLTVSNQLGCNSVLHFTVGICVSLIDNIADIQLKIYPNPVQDDLYITATEIKGVLNIFDLQGKLIRKEIVNGEKFSLKVGDLAPGLYLLRYESGTGVSRGRFVKD